jgi:hypothetical protein
MAQKHPDPLPAIRRFAESCEGFFRVCADTSIAEKERIFRISVVLAQLYAQCLTLPSLFSDTESDEREISYDLLRRDLLAPRFPSLGYYHTCMNPLDVTGTAQNGTGDAIDDLADIYIDLARGYEYFKGGDLENAAWFWKLTFHHWGKHALDLQRILFEIISKEDFPPLPLT